MTTYPYHRFFNQRCADVNAATAAIMSTATRAAQRYKQYFILDHSLIDDELQDARSGRLELEIVNPGISGLVAGTNPFMIVWEEFGPDDTPANCTVRICAMGRIVGIPSGLSAGSLRVVLDCRPDNWEATAMSLWENHLPAAIPATDVLPYSDRILTNTDFIESTWFVPRINPFNFDIDLVPVVNMNDVDPAQPAGNIETPDGDTIYDLTPFVLEDLEFSIGQAPVLAVAGELTVAWNQRVSGIMDLGGVIGSALIGNSPTSTGFYTDAVGAFYVTYTPEAFQSSLPHKGSELTTGVKIIIANYATIAGTIRADYSTEGMDLSSFTSEGFTDQLTGSSKVIARWAGFALQPGAENGVVAIFDYHQPRQEAVNVVVTMDVQPFTTTSQNYLEFKNQPLNDPTVTANLKIWLAGHSYARGDIAWFNGNNYYCITPHVAGSTLDASKWILIAVPNGVGATPAPYDANQNYVVGDLTLQTGNVFICQAATTGAFDATKWTSASGTPGLVLNWTPLTNYNSGTIIFHVQDSTYYVTLDNQTSGLTFDAALWEVVPASITNVALWPGAPEFLSTTRGATSIIWQQVRGYSLGLKRACALKGTFTMPYGVNIDGSLNTANMRKGTLFRIRNTKLPGGFSEIYEIVTSVNIRINGDNGLAEVKCGFRVAVGNGLNEGCTKVFQVPSTFAFQNAFQLIDTRLLGSPATVVRQVLILGDDLSTQQAAVQSAEAGGGTDMEKDLQNQLMANPNQLKIICQPLESYDLPILDHGAMVTPPMYVPKGIILS